MPHTSPRPRGWSWALLALLLVALSLTLPRPSLAQTGACLPAKSGKVLTPVGKETVTVSATVVGLSGATITTLGATAAFVTLEGTSALRFTLSGVPTATVGHLVDPPSAGSAAPTRGFWFCGQPALLGLRFLRTASPDLTLQVTYYQ